MNDNRKNESLALLLTLLLSGLTVLILVTSYLHYEPITDDLQLKQDTIMWGGEYVMLGDTPDPATDDMASEPSSLEQQDELTEVEGDDLQDAGEPTREPAPVVTTVKESPMKVKEKPKQEPEKKPGPATDKKTPEKKPEVKQTAANSATTNRVKNAFGNSAGSGSGKQGSPDGNSGQGVTIGKPGLSGLVGYTLDHWAKPNPNSRWSGTIQVRVRINPRGNVVEARATGGTGEAYTHKEIRTACEQAALKSAFSVPTNTTTEGVGTITYKWN